MQREDRAITHTFINFLIPLCILGLFALVYPYFLLVVTIEDTDVCWFYYLTRSPYSMNSIVEWLYTQTSTTRSIMTTLELAAFFYSVYLIRQTKVQSINIYLESGIILLIWSFINILSLMFYQSEEELA